MMICLPQSLNFSSQENIIGMYMKINHLMKFFLRLLIYSKRSNISNLNTQNYDIY